MSSDKTTLNGTQAYDKQSALAVIVPSFDKPFNLSRSLAVVGNWWLMLPAQVAPWTTPTQQFKTISCLPWKHVHFTIL